MDQIYIPKERPLGFEIGMPVLIKPATEAEEIKPVYYNIGKLEPIKVTIIQKIFSELSKIDNIVVTGSFLEDAGLNAKECILIDDKKIDSKKLEQNLKDLLVLNFHIIPLDYPTLIKGLETDPLYQAMLSKYVVKKRLIFKFKNKINYKLLDLHLLKSKPLLENFDYLTGSQKYDMARNLMAIFLFLDKKKINNETINHNIKKLLKEEPLNIKLNIIINKAIFLKEYKKLYNGLFNKILEGIKHGS